MSSKIADIVATLPADLDPEPSPQTELAELLAGLRHRAVPTGRVRRLGVLSTLPAKVAAAYAWNWVGSTLADPERRTRRKSETHMRAALILLGRMGYLRGMAAKLGQLFANYPDVLPEELSDVLEHLHFEAPPMHWSLLAELVHDELGAEPEERFAAFDREAFAAASLGQVHRARTRGGTDVAVKIQYPGIARTIDADFRNMTMLGTPMRLSSDWDNLIEQWRDIHEVCQREADYAREAANLERTARALADLAGDVVVPRPHRDLSTERVLTMDFVEGAHLREYLAGDPPQAERDRFGALILRVVTRLYYSERAVYADPHPGNFFFASGGRLGLVDLGCLRDMDADEWDLTMALVEGLRDEDKLREAIQRACVMTEDPKRFEQRYSLVRDLCEWYWEPLRTDAAFDFAANDYMQRGIRIFGECTRRGYTRSMPINNWSARCFFGVRSMLHALGARVEFKRIHDEELERAVG
jgi:predicted unusual protein kinase regulating ubiquinone biosynthesis (AarF/ABC1/UbiB family)